MFSGVILGLIAAFFQSTSYVCGRLFTARFNDGSVTLLALSHIIMALFSAIVLPLAIVSPMPGFSVYAFNMFCCAIFYLAGQFFFFMALRHINASRLSPLLGLKVFMLAIIGVAIMGQHFNTQQWIAILLSILGAYVLSYSGEKIGLLTMLWILLACFCYCISDLNIKALIRHFEYAGLLQASVTSACVTYIFCGVFAAAGLIFLPKPQPGMWTCSVPFAAAWFSSMMTLFVCFAMIGVVFGNIIQSLRGVISIVLGVVISSMGHITIETKVSRAVFFQRLGAASLLTAAIALYFFAKQ